ncbi:hypothetical protein A3K55_01410 [Candidatus Shapirobacteria bacterium RBG_13_44_7]|uniref:Apea-like HEPN domain-containing protein n=1 Tax=Candidatus Shapirobacteria bacterium RBG_13_44_7 TaxID=1802149 RepID=A0A1F7SHQ6_9BACT|nr:MAG: hypothetical protein A3K55_01410 [Candidatus Shapirobacteria bacterium RBG_13_44_7]
MVRNLTHGEWVLQQFEERYLRSSYRNVLIHASIIEGTLRNESGSERFYSANEYLNNNHIITPAEYYVFDEVRDTRNKLIHDSFKDGLEQNAIDELRDELMEKIHEAYRISDLLNRNLFQKYDIPRLAIITFNPM